MLITIREYAKRKGVSEQAVYDKIKRGTLKAFYENVRVMRLEWDEKEPYQNNV